MVLAIVARQFASMIRKYFAVASVLLLLAVVAIAIDDYNQEWRHWQRIYYTAIRQSEKGPLSLWDRLAIEQQLSLNLTKVVTDPGRSAEACMACHINQGGAQFAENPLRDLNEIHENVFVLKELPFDQIGCTACHGGDPLAVTEHSAHEHMLSRYRDIFRESLERLHSDQQMVRQRAIEVIRWMTGNDFGFIFDAVSEEREKAIQQAQAWWQLHKDTFLTAGLVQRESFQFANPQGQALAQRTDVSPLGEPLWFIGSQTCIGCHSNPFPAGTPYIPPSNKEHVEQWFQDVFKTSAHPELYLLNHPFLAEVWITQSIADPARRAELLELLETARRSGELPEPEKIEGLLESLRTTDLTCEACHGPGSGYAQLMMKGLALQFEGRTAEAAELIQTARETALANARRNLADSAIWRIYQQLISELQESLNPR
jgi:hypothetical protein